MLLHCLRQNLRLHGAQSRHLVTLKQRAFALGGSSGAFLIRSQTKEINREAQAWFNLFLRSGFVSTSGTRHFHSSTLKYRLYFCFR